MKQLIRDTLQAALNRYLALDPESAARLARLEGKVVAIELLGAGITMQLLFLNASIRLQWEEELPADTYIKGTPLTLLRMSLTEGDRKHFFADDVSITGNLDLGQAVIDLFDHLEIDWEEYLSRVVGDIPAHQVGQWARRLNKLKQRTRSIFLQNTNEYVHEEAELFPAREEISDFFHDVDSLRMDVDRMDARIAMLKKQYEANE